MDFPVIIINAKTYEQATGDRIGTLVEAARNIDANIYLCPQAADLLRVDIPALTQHVDPEAPGSHTGKNTIGAVRAAGAQGSLINHSEDRVDDETIRTLITQLREMEMTSIVCVKDVAEAARVAGYAPDIIAIEPPELIGGDISVTTADPQIVSDAVQAVRAVTDIPVLCGAGVKTGEDVRKALELGAAGVLVASGVVKADDQAAALRDLASGL